MINPIGSWIADRHLEGCEIKSEIVEQKELDPVSGARHWFVVKYVANNGKSLVVKYMRDGVEVLE